MINDTISQLNFISNKIVQLFEHIGEDILDKRPISNKMSVWEVCEHLTQIPKSDVLIQGIQELITYFEEHKKVELERSFVTY